MPIHALLRSARSTFSFSLLGFGALLTAGGAVVASCSDRTGPSPAVVRTELSSTGGAKAGGRADIHATPVQNVRDQTYSFTALPTGAFPLATGQVEVHFLQFTGAKFTVHAEVTCLSIVDNEAWVGSLVTRFAIDGQDQPHRLGNTMIFRVQDMGEGGSAADLASLVFFGQVPGGDLAHCGTQPEFPILRESTNGNIQVKPD